MRKCILLCLTGLILTAFDIQAQLAPPQDKDYIEQAKNYIIMMRDGKYSDVYNKCNDVLQQKINVSRLEEAWQTINSQAGKFKSFIDNAKVEDNENDKLVTIPVEFEKMNLDFFIGIDDNGRISNFTANPGENTKEYNSPVYAKPEKYTEKEINIGKGEWILPGTLTIPKGKGPFPAVILVHGSGPGDRDETIGPNKIFRDLALGLASNGIAVLRFEKRTKYYSDKIKADYNTFTVKEESVDDAVNAAELLRTEKEINAKKVYVLGHSLGGMLAPRIVKANPKLAGIILMAGSARPMEDAYIEQVTYLDNLDGNVSDEERTELDIIRRQAANVKDPNLNVNTPSDSLLLSIPAAYWLDLRKYNPAKTAETITKPILVLQGGRDYQVTMDDYNLWKSSLGKKKNVEFKLYAPLNHFFLPGEGPGTPSEYYKENHIPDYVINDIVKWVKSH